MVESEVTELPWGCQIHDLDSHVDSRGVLTEIYRDEWNVGREPCQWNLVSSRPNVLRGVHVHLRHWDYLIVIHGRMALGISDLREGSPTYGKSAMLELREDRVQAVTIPPGVAHGFYFPVASITVYSVSEYWDTDDELGCQWNDPGLALQWPAAEPILSKRDQMLPSLKSLSAQLRGHDWSTSLSGR